MTAAQIVEGAIVNFTIAYFEQHGRPSGGPEYQRGAIRSVAASYAGGWDPVQLAGLAIDYKTIEERVLHTLAQP